jgi:hypothetical protein
MMLLPMLMLAAQVASEAIKQGPSSDQAVTWTAVAMAIVANVGTWLMILKRASKEKAKAESAANAVNIKGQNPDPKPENSPWPEIREQGKILVRHDTEIKGIVKGMDENRLENHQEHLNLMAAINSLRTGKQT